MQRDDASKHRSKSSKQLNIKNDHPEAVLQQLCWVSIYKESLQAVCKHQQSFLLSSCPSACHITSIISITEDGGKCALYVPLLKTHTCCPHSLLRSLWGVVVPSGVTGTRGPPLERSGQGPSARHFGRCYDG